jgi:GH43 family beta-xylosidase
MKKSILACLAISLIIPVFAQKTIKRADLFVRDPFILADAKTQTYYLYASAKDTTVMPNGNNGVVVYRSKDLENWDAPKPIFEIPNDIWASPQHGAWAPEAHFYKGQYYLFVTLSNPQKLLTNDKGRNMPTRGTTILVSETPDGNFKILKKTAHTPTDWMALDGTLFVENGQPYLVFCHEWIQVTDGTFELVKLSKDLSDTEGVPKTLFKATDAAWVKSINAKQYNSEGFVTDGAWFYRTKTGKLLMLWSSFCSAGYAVGIAESSNGKIGGKWTQQKDVLFAQNGGHPMLFKAFDGRLLMILHQPNSGAIRARIFEMTDLGHTLTIKKEVNFKE